MRCCAAVTGAPASGARSAASRVGGQRGATQETTQRRVVRALLEALGERLRMDRAEYRPATRLNKCHDHFQVARPVKHDSVSLRAAVGNLHEFAYAWRLHGRSVLTQARSAIPNAGSDSGDDSATDDSLRELDRLEDSQSPEGARPGGQRRQR